MVVDSLLIIKALFTFATFMEIMVVMHILTKWLMRDSLYTKKIYQLLTPVLEPVSKMLEHSVLKTSMIDFSPIIVLIVIAFIQQFLYSYM